MEAAQHWQAQGFGLIQAFSTSTLLKFWTREFFALGWGGGRRPVYCKMLAASLASTKCQECLSSCDTQTIKLPLIGNHWFSLITAEPKQQKQKLLEVNSTLLDLWIGSSINLFFPDYLRLVMKWPLRWAQGWREGDSAIREGTFRRVEKVNTAFLYLIQYFL